ncbi:MAG TPA: orotidine 5'-phosphate decarboxylase [Nitrososphaera sp.]|nr:orotidine 5'-phosphate decarboxylase [Nitrososphaera sp.]
MAKPYRERIAHAAAEKKSRIILAIDPAPSVVDIKDFAERTIASVQEHVCAIKVNFHMILPLSGAEIAEINQVAHSCGLQCIADIKLNDIENTNDVAIDHLIGKMGFDCVIANPFIGNEALQNLVKKSRQAAGGIIALAYMSHPGAKEGYGMQVEGKGDMYRIFIERAAKADADGIVVGASHLSIIKGIAGKLPLYSPGIGVQGGNAESAAKGGADYVIIGRSIIESKEPGATAKELKQKISAAVRD